MTMIGQAVTAAQSFLGCGQIPSVDDLPCDEKERILKESVWVSDTFGSAPEQSRLKFKFDESRVPGRGLTCHLSINTTRSSDHFRTEIISPMFDATGDCAVQCLEGGVLELTISAAQGIQSVRVHFDLEWALSVNYPGGITPELSAVPK